MGWLEFLISFESYISNVVNILNRIKDATNLRIVIWFVGLLKQRKLFNLTAFTEDEKHLKLDTDGQDLQN